MVKQFVGALAALAITATANAQTAAPAAMTPASGGFTVTLAGGAAFPVGQSHSYLKTGWTGMGGIGFNLPWLPFALRAEAGYDQSNLKDMDVTGHVDALTVGLNGIAQLPVHTAGLSPYITAGLGYGHVSNNVPTGGEDESAPGSENKLAWNAGLGVKWTLTHFDMFVEGRYSAIETDQSYNGRTSFVPVMVGITLRP